MKKKKAFSNLAVAMGQEAITLSVMAWTDSTRTSKVRTDVVVRALSMRQGAQAMALIGQMRDNGEVTIENIQGIKLTDHDWVKSLLSSGDLILQLLSMCSGQAMEFFDLINASYSPDMVQAFVEVNADFFDKMRTMDQGILNTVMGLPQTETETTTETPGGISSTSSPEDTTLPILEG